MKAGQAISGASMHAPAHAAASYSDPAMLSWQPWSGSADADLLPDLEALVSRSRDLSRNNGVAAGGMQTLKDNIIGAVLRLSATPDSRLLGWAPDQAHAWSRVVEAEFRSFADTTECDAAGEQTLLGLTLQALGGAMGNGDALALPVWVPRGRWFTKLNMIESDRLATPPGRQFDTSMRAGREIDQYGGAVAYHIRKRHPGDIFGAQWLGAAADEFERVPAYTPWGRRRVIYLHDKERTGQSRGKPILASVMREFHMAGKYATTELQAAVANGMIAAFIESDLGQDAAASLFGDEPRKEWETNVGQMRNTRLMSGPQVIPLPVGAKLSAFTPSRPNAAFDAFMVATFRNIAAGLNIPYELLLKDFSRTSYSSARAALLEAWRYFHGRRRWLTDYWLRPIYELWLEEAVNAGRISAPDFYANRYAYTRCRFIFAGRGWVDPVKEATAAKIRIEAGLSTMEAECAEQGADWEEVLEQQAIEQRRRAELGLPPIAPVSIVTVMDGANQDGATQQGNQQ